MKKLSFLFMFQRNLSFYNVHVKHTKFPGINTLFSSLLIPEHHVYTVCSNKGKKEWLNFHIVLNGWCLLHCKAVAFYETFYFYTVIKRRYIQWYWLVYFPHSSSIEFLEFILHIGVLSLSSFVYASLKKYCWISWFILDS